MRPWQHPLDREACDLERDLLAALYRRDRSALRATRSFRQSNDRLPPQTVTGLRGGSQTGETVHG